MSRKANVKRSTAETSIQVSLEVDGSGRAEVSTGIAFFDHMLALFCKHGLFDLSLKAEGDLEVDQHHTVEDTGIVLGEAFKEALGDKGGINRFGSAMVPMGESLARVVLDICSRPYLAYGVSMPKMAIGGFSAELIEEFLRAFCDNSGVTLHVDMLRGGNLHHQAEAVFKALGRALAQAASLNPRIEGPPSTKGML